MPGNSVQTTILDAALRLIVRGGLPSATVDAIAAESGMTKGGIFYYYPNKRELLSSAVHRFVESIFEGYRAELSRSEADPKNIFPAMVAAIRGYTEGIEQSHSGIGILVDPAYQGIIAKAKREIYLLVRNAERPDSVTAITLLVLDGLWVSRFFQPRLVSSELEKKALEQLHAVMAKDRIEPAPPPQGTTGYPQPEKSSGPPIMVWPADPSDTRGALLNAAEKVLALRGLAGLTLSEVALEAGSSKGGLLHHFRSKRDLLDGVLDRLELRFFQRRDALLTILPDTPSRLARATFMTIMQSRRKNRGTALYRVDMLGDIHFRARIQAIKERTYEDIFACSRHPEKVLLSLFLLDGLWLGELFKPHPIPRAIVKKCWTWLHRSLGSIFEDVGNG